MPFHYPGQPHKRKHGPDGYAIYFAFKPWLRDEFSFRCVYCLVRERWQPSGLFGFPADLPNLIKLRPARNSRPEGVAESFWSQRNENRLPQTYL